MDANDKLELLVSVATDKCAVAGLPKNIEWFMKGLEGRFKINRGEILKKHLGVDCEWGLLPNGKSYCKATMVKKVEALVKACEENVGEEAKTCKTPGNPHEYLARNEETEPVEVEKHRSLVGQLMLFTTKLCPKTGTATRDLSGFT